MKKLTKVLAGTVLAGGIGLGVYAFSDNTPNVFAANDAISEKQAEDIALQRTNGGSVNELEFDRDDQKDKYEIEVHKDGKSYDLDILAGSGKITKFEEDRDDDLDESDIDDKDDEDRDDQVDAANMKISTEQAQNIALKQVPGTVTKIELDEEDGQYFYEIEINKDKQETDVDVDAMTGTVLKVDKDEDNN
ncbi:PepSY domain-containing protein [Fictibacillus barbaricus]|uniref:PepSY domain-containing protein n=1 Tax=Fictibacillus barbaricus TaxID=182136 RepID=A0ABS2ZKH1_9BACL|nr:PepSY domain-containing protein [Fictibacillus barbaricus]MBN3547205.1 PepSY domain-containing protein [Fictibacillus barbaricus]GGB47177.1 hypothetical protein GCM10007199_10830 [Fictibacillus barbaricus]